MLQKPKIWEICLKHPGHATQMWPLKLEAQPSTFSQAGSENFAWPKPFHFRPELPPAGGSGGMRTGLIQAQSADACSEVRCTQAEPCGTRQKWMRWAQTHPAVFSFILRGGIQHLIKNPGSNTIMLVTAKPTSKAQWVLWTPHHWLLLWAILVWWWPSSSLVSKGFYISHADLFLQCKNIYFNQISQKAHYYLLQKSVNLG